MMNSSVNSWILKNEWWKLKSVWAEFLLIKELGDCLSCGIIGHVGSVVGDFECMTAVKM